MEGDKNLGIVFDSPYKRGDNKEANGMLERVPTGKDDYRLFGAPKECGLTKLQIR